MPEMAQSAIEYSSQYNISSIDPFCSEILLSFHYFVLVLNLAKSMGRIAPHTQRYKALCGVILGLVLVTHYVLQPTRCTTQGRAMTRLGYRDKEPKIRSHEGLYKYYMITG